MIMNSAKHSSNRKFGTLFMVVFILLSAYEFHVGNQNWKVLVFLASGILMGGGAFLAPNLLEPLNKSWMTIGELMGKLISPLVLGVIFFLIITPVALLTRIFGRDELRLKIPKKSSTYWVNRIPIGPKSDSFIKPF